MKIIVFGGTGFTGKQVVKAALDKGHKVTVFTRNSGSISIAHNNLTVIEGEVMDLEIVKQVLTNQHAVIQCLGIGGKGNGLPNTFVSDANRVIIQAMQDQHITRYVAMSNVGAGDSYDTQPWIAKKIVIPYFIKWLQPIIDDKNIMEPDIMNSNLNWTIVRFPNITNKPPKHKYSISKDASKVRLSITNNDVAEFLVQQLSTDEYSKQAICVSN